MLEQITWAEFFTALTIAAVIYYGVIAYLFYREELKGFLRGAKKIKEKDSKAEQIQNEKEQENDKKKAPPSTIEELEAVVHDLRYGILEKAGSGAGKVELMEKISNRLASYDGLRKPAFRMAITNFIVQQAKEINGVSFSDEELDAEWSRLLDR